MQDATTILTRHERNPLITVEDVAGASRVYNLSPATHDGQTVLLLSVFPFTSPRGGETRVARSEDGIRFDIEPEPFIRLHEYGSPFDAYCNYLIDNRVTQIGSTYYLLTPAMSASGGMSPVTVLGETEDFHTYEPIEIIDYPRVRGTSLFPEQIGGQYYKLIRAGAGTGSVGEIWIASSPDLVHWGRYRHFLSPGYSASWNSKKIGPTPPIKTSKGWLEMIHGVNSPHDGAHYYIGAVLMDLDEPWRLIGKTYSFLLAADTQNERCGRVSNVVFPCGAVVDETRDEIKLCYGAADTSIALATGIVSDVIKSCLDQL